MHWYGIDFFPFWFSFDSMSVFRICCYITILANRTRKRKKKLISIALSAWTLYSSRIFSLLFFVFQNVLLYMLNDSIAQMFSIRSFLLWAHSHSHHFGMKTIRGKRFEFPNPKTKWEKIPSKRSVVKYFFMFNYVLFRLKVRSR